MSFLGFGGHRRLGIDIGTASIKIVELTKESGRFKLENYGLFSLESAESAVNVATQAVQQSNKVAQLSNNDMAWAIKELCKAIKVKTKDAVASIQSFSTFSTVISMPYLSADDIAKSIPYEARKYVPIPLTDVVLDWSIINVAQPGANQAPGATPTVEVYLVAVPKNETNRYQEITQQAGIHLKALELENAALIRALIGNDLNPFTIINIGGRSTSIVIVDGGFERVSHNYEIGGFEITKAISRSLNVSIKRAEELKRTFGLKDVDNNVINTVMSSLLDMIVLETRKTIQNYQDVKRRTIAKVLLVGGQVNMPQFAEYFAQKLGLPVSLGNPLARVIVPPPLEKVRGELSSTFAIALGLAMREL